MGIARHFIHTCTIQRASVTQDDLNQDVLSYADWLTDEPCRLVVKDQRNPFGPLAQDPVIETDMLLVSAECDVVEGDQVTAIQFDDGSTDPGPYRIESIRNRRSSRLHHKSLILERVK